MDRFLDLEKKTVEERVETFRSVPVTDVEKLKKGGVLQRYEIALICLYENNSQDGITLYASTG